MSWKFVLLQQNYPLFLTVLKILRILKDLACSTACYSFGLVLFSRFEREFDQNTVELSRSGFEPTTFRFYACCQRLSLSWTFSRAMVVAKQLIIHPVLHHEIVVAGDGLFLFFFLVIIFLHSFIKRMSLTRFLISLWFGKLKPENYLSFASIGWHQRGHFSRRGVPLHDARLHFAVSCRGGRRGRALRQVHEEVLQGARARQHLPRRKRAHHLQQSKVNPDLDSNDKFITQ